MVPTKDMVSDAGGDRHQWVNFLEPQSEEIGRPAIKKDALPMSEQDFQQ
jgi:hypothetical protein